MKSKPSITIILLLFTLLKINFTYSQQINTLIQIGGPGTDQLESMLPNSDGTSIVAGTFADSIYVNKDSLNKLKTIFPDDIYLYKLKSNGSVLWHKTLGTPGGYNHGSVLVKDNHGNFYLGGEFSSSFTTDGQNLVGDQLLNMFIIKYNSQGLALWSKYFPSNGYTGISSMICDLDGNLYALGSSVGTSITIDGQKFTDSTIHFIVKYDSSGNVRWSKILSGHNSFFDCISLGLSENLYVGGYAFQGQIYYDDKLVGKADSSQGIIFANINSTNGSLIWEQIAYSKTIPSPGAGLIKIKTANSGNIFAIGIFSDNLTIQGKRVDAVNEMSPPNGDINFCLIEFDRNGKILLINGKGIGGSNYSFNMDMDYNNNLYITGDYKANYPIGKGNLVGTGESDAFIVKYDSLGNYIASETTEGSSAAISSTGTRFIYLNTNNDITVGGSFNFKTYFGNDSLSNRGFYDGFIWEIGNSNLGIENLDPMEFEYGLALYPNPANSGHIILKCQFPIKSVQFYDNSGKLVYQNNNNANNLISQYFISGFPSGLYFVRVVTSVRTFRLKFIKD